MKKSNRIGRLMDCIASGLRSLGSVLFLPDGDLTIDPQKMKSRTGLRPEDRVIIINGKQLVWRARPGGSPRKR